MVWFRFLFFGLVIVAETSPVRAADDIACDDLNFTQAIPAGFVSSKSDQRLNMTPEALKKGWEKFEICPVHGPCYERYRYTAYWKNVTQWRAKVCLELASEDTQYMLEGFSGTTEVAMPVVRFVTRDSKKEPWRLLTEHAYGVSTVKRNPKTFAWMYEGPPRTVGIQIVSATERDSFDIMTDKSKKPVAVRRNQPLQRSD